MTGPKAPKDPTKKREGFYIMHNKDIAAAPQADGTGMCPIYESDGRLINAAKLVGNIADEEELKCLETVEGFKKLVHSIGVTVESDKSDDNVHFVFQMYGKNDLYGGGTNLTLDLPMDGMEYIIPLEDITWREDDDVPGQIRYEFKEPGIKAIVSVKLYLNDGFSAPPVEEETPIDFESEDYKEIIEKSLVQTGNNYRLKKAIDKAKAKENVSIAFIGGSITQGAGAVPINSECYARKIYEGFCDITGNEVDSNIKYVKAGVGGTPSEVGILRYEKDILSECTPDVVIVEFAVNDEGDETKGDFYDSLVRKIYNGPGKPAVILLFAVFANDWNLQDRLGCVGESYNLPMVSTLNSVVDQFKKKKGEGKVLSKNQFFYDMFHPTNAGHKIMADGVLNLMKIVDTSSYDDEAPELSDIIAPKSAEFENIVLVDRKNNTVNAVINEGSFKLVDTELQFVERNMNLKGSPEFADNWMYDGSKIAMNEYENFTLDVECTALVLAFKDSADNGVGKADIYVDGEKVYYADPRVNGWTHCNAAIILRNAPKKIHHVEVRLSEGSENKLFTILGFGVVAS